MKQLHALVAAVATAAVLGLGAPTEAATISNFNQNPANGGLSASNGVLSISNIAIDYSFQVPPNNLPAPANTVPALLGLTGTITVTSLGGGNYIANNVALGFTIVGTTAPYAGVNLLSGNLQATVLVNANTNSITLQGTGSSWTSSSPATYNVGAGAQTANFLQGQTFSMSLLNLASITIGGGGQLNFTSVSATPGGSSITGNFAAVPEPASLVLMGLGLAGIPGVVALRKRAARA